MCCFATLLILAGPRLGIFVWWLVEPARWSLAFDTFIWPFLGFVFVPWTTLMYVFIFPGGVDGFDWIWLGLAFVLDVLSWTGGGYSNRDRLTGYYSG